MTIAAPGSGKSMGAVVPNLAVHDGPVFAIDPAGELAALTAGRRGKLRGHGIRGMGQGVYVVDPFRLPILEEWGRESACYNVFDEMAAVAERNPDAPVRYAGKIADSMVEYSEGPNVFFDRSAHTFLRGLILYIFTHEPPERRNLVRLRELVTIGDREGFEEQTKQGNR